jgi:hypothetical protein
MRSFMKFAFHEILVGDQITENEMAGHVEGIGGMNSTYNILIRQAESKRRLERFRNRWEDNIN